MCKLSQPSSHCTCTCFAATGPKLTSCASAVPNLRPRSCLAALFLLFDQKGVPLYTSVWAGSHKTPRLPFRGFSSAQIVQTEPGTRADPTWWPWSYYGEPLTVTAAE